MLFTYEVNMKDYKIINEKYLISDFLNEHGIKNIMSLKPIDIKNNEKYFINDLAEVLKQMQIVYKSINVTRQTHSNNIAVVKGSGINFYNETDGLIGTRGNVLVVKSADCLPVIIFDNSLKRIAAVHSGWKGTANSIVKDAIKKMLELGSNAAELSLYIGAHIQEESFEVKSDVKNIFQNKFSYEEIITQKDEEHYLIDLGKIVKFDAMSLGVEEKNIYISKIDTVKDKRFHSYRRDRENYGLMYTLVCI